MANLDTGTSNGNARGGEYQVFLNFRGPDTRDVFTDFLYHGLVDNGIRVFKDDKELRFGEVIPQELLRAIDNSQIYIPIFSKNYVSSRWCLRELARIVDNAFMSDGRKKILPIFFDVEPDDVKLKTPLYECDILEHKNKFPDEVDEWQEALIKVDQIKGWNLPKYQSRAELIKLVVKEVLVKLKIRYKFVTKHLVGLDDQVQEVKKLLKIECSDVRLIGIHGMGGIGKTTLAKVIFNQLSSHFGKCCTFIDDIRENSKKDGLIKLQEKLLSDIGSSSTTNYIDDVDYGMTRIEETICNKKVLIVLDDIDKSEQIEKLIGRDPLHPGTRIIITTRNKSLLQAKDGILPYEMREMGFYHALQLFSRHAFDRDSPLDDFNNLSRDIISTTGGLPLALEVIGSFLYRKNEAIWKETLDKLREIPHEDVRMKLKISYDALDKFQQNIFLDIACFLINEDKTNAIYMWTDCKFYPNIGIEVLISMSLIKILHNNRFWMHDQLRDLGREIVRQESATNLAKRSRLWIREEAHETLRIKERKENVEALHLHGSGTHILITNEEIEKFQSLRFFKLYNGTFDGDFTDCLPKLRWISWHSPHPGFSAAKIHSKNLVVLELFDNHFTNDSEEWSLIKMASKLKVLALVECHGITRTPDLSGCLTLERLTFDNCGSLKKIDSSIGKLKYLLDLNITRSWYIEDLPEEIGELVKLKRFSLKSCYKVRKLPVSLGNLTSLMELDLSTTRITSLPDSIGKLKHLSILNVFSSRITGVPNSIEGLVELKSLFLGDTKLGRLSDSIGKLKSLRILDLSSGGLRSDGNRWELPNAFGTLENLEELYLGHRKELVGEIPLEIGNLSSLRVLDLTGTQIHRVPSTISMLSCLLLLDFTWCDKIEELPELPTSLVCLRVKSSSLQSFPDLSKLTNLEELILSDGSEYQARRDRVQTCDLEWIGRLTKLRKLDLCLLNVTAPPTALGLLSLLQELTLRRLDLQHLRYVPDSLLSLVLEFFDLGSLKVNLRSVYILKLRYCQLLERLFIPSSVRRLEVSHCSKLIEIQFLGTSGLLEELSIIYCRSIERIGCNEVGAVGVLSESDSSSELTVRAPVVLLLANALKNLRKLLVSNCQNLLEIRAIGTLLSLRDFSVEWCEAMEKLSGISNLRNLHRLYVYGCSRLRVVEGLEELECLVELDIQKCHSLERLINISKAKIQDKCLIRLRGCKYILDSLPESHIPFKRFRNLILLQREQNPNP